MNLLLLFQAISTQNLVYGNSTTKNSSNVEQNNKLKEVYVEGLLDHGYFPSKYDITALKKYRNDIGNLKNFLLNHNAKPLNPIPNKMSFGNFSIASLNANLNKDMLEDSQKNILMDFLDTHHPSVMLMQSTSKTLMEYIGKLAPEHYKVTAQSAVEIDKITMKNEYKPIIFDSKILGELISGEFGPPEPNQTYATYAVFEVLDTKDVFMVVNIDLYSMDPSVTETEMMVILKHIMSSAMKNYSIFIGGTMNVRSKNLKDVFGRAFKDLIQLDKHNKDLSENTFHDHGMYYDGIAKDFIFLRDVNNIFNVNYSRILNGFDKISFMRYPIYSILTIRPKTYKTYNKINNFVR